MGSVIRTVFGGSSSKNKSQSNNQAYPWAQQAFGGSSANAFNGGLGSLAGILGVGGDPNSGSTALNNFFDSSGGNFLLNQGTDAVNSNMYARGLGTSGADMKGLEDYRQGLASTKLQDYIGDLNNYAKLGLGGGSLVTDAGQQSSSSGSSVENSGGLGKFIGGALSFISDPRAKRDIERIDDWDGKGDGLGRYRFRYADDPSRKIVEGVMADEVKRLRPWAFIPNFRGELSGVNYGAL